MAEKTDEQLIQERSELAAQTAAIDRQIAAKRLAKTEAFVALLNAKVKPALIADLEEGAVGLTDFSAQYAAQLIQLLRGTPNLLAIEVEKLKAASAEPPTLVPPVTPES